MWTRALMVVAMLFVAVAGETQSQYAKALIGKWEGDIQMARGRNSPDRTLIIEAVGEGEGTVPIKGQYGTTGEKLGRMEGTLDVSGGQPVVRFTTRAGSSVVLNLRGEKDLVGTIDFKGTSQRAQDHAFRLKKVE